MKTTKPTRTVKKSAAVKKSVKKTAAKPAAKNVLQLSARRKAMKQTDISNKTGLRKLAIASGTALVLAMGLLMGKSVFAADNTSSLKSLGDQSKIIEKARPTVPANTYRVVQKRVIDREYRSELGISTGMVAGGGDSYYQTSHLGVQYDFHLGNRVSIGARYQMNFNELTPEGKRIYDRAEAMAGAGNSAYVVPDLDQPKSTALATISFYPIYGKVSWFESTVSYFDFYVMGGAGTMELKNGNSPVLTGGVGMGMWWNQYLSSRLEMRYQSYEDQIFTGKRKIEGAVASFTMGLLL